MTASADAGRGRAAVRIGFAAALLAALALAFVMRDLDGRRIETLYGAVLPTWPEDAAAVTRIHVATADQSFDVERGEAGWSLSDRGGYPADHDAIRALGRGLARLEFLERKTDNSDKHERLGLDDPATGGSGARLSMYDASGAALASLIIGDGRRGGGFYVRLGDSDQTFAVSGVLPAIETPADWLNLDFLPLERDQVAVVRITPEDGPAYVLTRPTPETRDYSLLDAPAGWSLLTAGAGNTVAGAMAQLRFEDVRRADTLEGEAIARHEVLSFDGLELGLSIFADGEERWAVLDASVEIFAEVPDADDEDAVMEAPSTPLDFEELDAALDVDVDAVSLNAQTDGWAYRLPEYAAERLARSLDAIASQDEG